ncbi:MAG: hypothetical protein AB1781_11225 [Pseudomonadota bacterium]
MTRPELRLELLKLIMGKAPQNPDLTRIMGQVEALEAFLLEGQPGTPALPVKRGPGRPRKESEASTDTPSGPV